MSVHVKLEPAKLARFVAWRASGKDPGDDIGNMGLVCPTCSFVGSSLRFDKGENYRIYHDYRGPGYNADRILCEPEYLDKMAKFDRLSYVSERQKGITKLIKSRVDIKSINSVLDYGGDTGFYIPTAFKKANRYVFDISDSEPITGIKKYDPDTHENPVDFLMCCQVLEHSSNPDELLAELKQYIDKNSWLYIEVPNNPEPYVGTFHEHLNMFNKKALKALLKRNGIRVVDTYAAENLCMLTKLL